LAALSTIHIGQRSSLAIRQCLVIREVGAAAWSRKSKKQWGLF
jgi:hypothetical protein